MFRESDFDRCYSVKPKSAMDPLVRGEKKRQQSRSAARSRRLTESEIFAQLIETLPTIDQPTIYQTDRIGALRLALTLCRVRRVGERFFGGNNENSSTQSKFSPAHKNKLGRTIADDAAIQASMNACMEGFLMVVNKVGQLLYVTPSVAESIGFTQIDLVGRYLRDYVHTDDWRELRDHLCSAGSDKKPDTSSKTFFRMKTALTPRGGRARKLTMAVYQPLQAYVVKPSATRNGASFEGFDYDEGSNTSAETDEDIRLMHCIPFTLSSTRRSPSEMIAAITSRHDLDMRFRICDESFAHNLGFKNAKSFIGRSFYDLIHPEDVDTVVRDVREMYRKCHSRTGYYRLLNRLGESVWVMSEMLLLVQNIRGAAQKSVVCTHQILSESSNHTMDTPRLMFRQQLKPVKEYDLEEEEVEYVRTDEYTDRCEDMEPEVEPITPVQSDGPCRNQLINQSPLRQQALQSPFDMVIGLNPVPIEPLVNQAPIIDLQTSPWGFETRLCPDTSTENSKALAPFIPDDSQNLTLEEDPEMPGLLPAHWDYWLCGKPIPQVQNMACPKPAAEKPAAAPVCDPNQNLMSNDVLPLDFADIFGMDIEGTDQFSIDEAERAFSQFDPPAMDDIMGRTSLNTPVSQIDTKWMASSSDFTVPITDGGTARKKTLSSKKPTKFEHRLDSKTIEAFEKQLMDVSPRSDGQQPSDDPYWFGDDDYLMTRPSGRPLHHKSSAAQIDNIEKELYRETQRFLA